MIVKILKRGKSFKGVWQYHFHDKRSSPEQPHPKTSDRVQFSGTRNLGTQDPQTAWRMMAFTCNIASYLKAEAGISNRGRKCTHPVLPLMTSYGRDQRPSREEIERDLDKVLSILRLSEHEIFWAAHTDTNNFHVHILINTVHPKTGKTAQFLQKDAQLLQDWAAECEREWGHVQCHKRGRGKGFSGRKRKQSYAEFKARQRGEINPSLLAEADRLAEEIRTAWARHYAEKHKIEKQHKESLSAIYVDSKKARSQVKAASASMIRSVYKYEQSPLIFTKSWHRKQEWKRFGKRISAAKRLYFYREKSISGIFMNAAMLALANQGKHGFLDYLFNKDLRLQGLNDWIKAEKEKLIKQQNLSKIRKIERIRASEHRSYANIAKTIQSRIEQENEIYSREMEKRKLDAASLKSESALLWNALGEGNKEIGPHPFMKKGGPAFKP